MGEHQKPHETAGRGEEEGEHNNKEQGARTKGLQALQDLVAMLQLLEDLHLSHDFLAGNGGHCGKRRQGAGGHRAKGKDHREEKETHPTQQQGGKEGEAGCQQGLFQGLPLQGLLQNGGSRFADKESRVGVVT